MAITAATMGLSGDPKMNDALLDAFLSKTIRAGNYHLARQAIGHGLIEVVEDIKTMWTPHPQVKKDQQKEKTQEEGP